MQDMRRLCWFAVCCLMAACGDASGPGDADAVIITTVAPANARLGDTVRVTMKVTNVSEEAVEVIFNGCNNDFTLQRAESARYYPAEQVVCTLASVAPVVLAAGESVSVQEFTTGRVVTEGDPASAPAMIPPGTYLVRPTMAVIRGDEEGVDTQRSAGRVTFRAP